MYLHTSALRNMWFRNHWGLWNANMMNNREAIDSSTVHAIPVRQEHAFSIVYIVHVRIHVFSHIKCGIPIPILSNTGSVKLGKPIWHRQTGLVNSQRRALDRRNFFWPPGGVVTSCMLLRHLFSHEVQWLSCECRIYIVRRQKLGRNCKLSHFSAEATWKAKENGRRPGVRQNHPSLDCDRVTISK